MMFAPILTHIIHYYLFVVCLFFLSFAVIANSKKPIHAGRARFAYGETASAGPQARAEPFEPIKAKGRRDCKQYDVPKLRAGAMQHSLDREVSLSPERQLFCLRRDGLFHE